MHKTLLFALSAISLVLSQTNTWTRGDNSAAAAPGCKSMGALVYSADSNRMFLTMGWVFDGNWNPASRYSELVMRLPDTRWINYFPKDTLYGTWGDSLGNATGAGGNVSAAFSMVAGFLRPGLYGSAYRSFYQYAYDSDEYCIYYYMAGRTLRYRTRTRRWDSLAVTVHPAGAEGGTSPLIWGSMCYDPYNREVLLCGGANADVRNGDCGTWVLKISEGRWEKLALSEQPPPRCFSQMVYDAKNRCIILFGGDHLDYLTADTWVYDCATRTWSNKNPALSPAPRAGHALLYLPKSRAVVLLGGYNYNPGYKRIAPMEMWRYDVALNEWGLIKTFADTDVRPAWLFQSIAAADTGDRIAALGDSSAYGGWHKLTFVMSCDPTGTDVAGTSARGVVSGTTLKWGGANDPDYFTAGVPAANPDSLENLYQHLPPNTWVTMKPPKNPNAARDWSAIAFVPSLDQVLVWGGGHSAYCGSDVAHFTLGTNRWSIGYVAEHMLNMEGDGGNSGYYPGYFTFNNRPFMPGHTRRGYCYSNALKKMVATKSNRTYLYDPAQMDWDTLRPYLHTSMGIISNTSYCLVDTRYGVFRWESGAGLYLLDTTLAWRPLPMKNAAKAPAYYDLDAGAVFDEKRNRVLMVSKNALLGQVWAYDFDDSTLTALDPAGSYNTANSFWRDPVYLPGPDMLFIQGDSSSSLYDCAANRWSILPTTRSAGMYSITGSNAAATFDPNRNLVVSMNTSWHGLQVNVMRVVPDSVHSGLSTAAKDHHGLSGLFVSSNPFNPAVRITLTGALKSGAALKVFDLTGKLIVDLSPALTHGMACWNASGTASGIYAAVAQKGALRLAKRIVYSK